MPKRVHLPDGRIVNFPDAMTPDQISAAMMKLSGGAQQPTAPPALATAGMMPSSTMDETPAATTADNIRNTLKWGGKVIAGMTGMGAAGREAVEHPVATLAMAAVPGVIKPPIPSSARAGAKFQQVMAVAKDAPVDISGPGNAALRIMQLSERGGTMPKAVRDLLKRVTDPEKGPLRYEEARDFASNISRLSADEFNRLTPALKREVGNLRVTLNHAIEKTAASVGQGKTYQSAMKEYRRAARGREIVDDAKDFAKRWAIPGGIATYGANKLADLLRD